MQSLIISSKDQASIDNYLTKIYKDFTINVFDINVIDHEKTVGIEEVRNLQQKIYLKPVKGKYKAWIVKNAENLTIQAQNALLKILEEPPVDTILILTTANYDLLLPTIISRCKIIEIRNKILDFSIDKLQGLAGFLDIAFSESISKKLKLSEEVGKSREDALGFLETLTIAARQNLINIIDDNSHDLLIPKYLNLLVSLNKTYFIVKTTNVNQRFCLENLFLAC